MAFRYVRNIWAVLRQLADKDVWTVADSGSPTNGTTGAGMLGAGSVYVDTNTGIRYVNIGTKTSPAWVQASDLAEITVSSAELLALRATPKTLVAAPGAGKVLEYLGAILIYDAGGVGYTVGTNDMAIRYKDTTGDIISQTIDTAGFIDDTTDRMTQVLPIVTDSKTPKTDCENQPLVLHNTGAGEFTGGTGVIRAKVSYRIWTTGW
jgi:hypothetical protein